MKLFPELSTYEELDETVKKTTHLTIKDLKKETSKIASCKYVAESEKILVISESLPFNTFYEIILSPFIKKLNTTLKDIEIIENLDKFTNPIIKHFIELIENRVNKMMINEMQEQVINYSGFSDHDYYHLFNSKIINDEFIKKCQNKYPNFFIYLDKIVNRSIKYINNLLMDTQNHWVEISNSLHINSNEKVRDIELGSGDTHKDGKSVVVINLTSNKIVYKPRNLSIDIRFQEFLQYLNLNYNLEFKLLNMYSQDNYGWSEYVENLECTLPKDVDEYYYHIGALLAILHCFNGYDMHYDNIIAHGKHPIIIDLESLFNTNIKSTDNDTNLSEILAQDILKNSVHNIALLPITILGQNNKEYLDLGGVSKQHNQISIFKEFVIEDSEAPQSSSKLKNLKLSTKKNNPLFENNIIDSNNYKSSIKQGFIYTYNLFMNNKENISKKMKILFQDLEVRYIHRNTMTYAKLLNIITYPDFLKNKFLERLILCRIAITNDNKDSPFLSSEYNDLINNDIPFFTINTSEKKIYNSSKEQISNILEKTPLSNSINKLYKFSKKDLHWQLHLIDMSYLNKFDEINDTTDLKFNMTAKDNIDKNFNKLYLSNAENIGDYIINNMISIDDNAYWIGTSLGGERENIWTPGILNIDLYSGNAGIAIFLAKLYSITHQEKYKLSALKALNPILTIMKKSENEINNFQFPLGFFSGYSGCLYSVFKVGKFLKEEKLIDEFFNLSLNLLLVPKTPDVDFINGVAGTITMLLNISSQIVNNKRKAFLINLSEKLEEKHLYEYSLEKSEIVYSGFSHGISGIISMYALLYRYTKCERYKNKIIKLYDLLESFFDKDIDDWLIDNCTNDISKGWCHGSPGILLMFLILKESGIDINLDKMYISLKNTIKMGLGNNLTMCHGDIGTLSIVKKYTSLFNDKNYEKYRQHTFDDFYHKISKNILKNKKIRHTYSFGLMIGIVGVGISLLNEYTQDDVNPLIAY